MKVKFLLILVIVFLIDLSAFAQTASVTVNANGDVLNVKQTNFPTGKLKVNGVIISGVSDIAFASSWNGVIDVAASKNALYDWAHLFDTDDDGKPNVLDQAAGIPVTDANGVLQTPITNNSTNWNTAFTDRLKWDGGASGLVPATGRLSLELGTAAILNVPATGDAASGEVVKGSDTRLTNARTPTAHTHTGADLSGIDISDDTNLAGTANEITLTGDTLSLHSAITRDAEWDSIVEIETAIGGGNIILATEIDTTDELAALLTDAPSGTGVFVRATGPTLASPILTTATITLTGGNQAAPSLKFGTDTIGFYRNALNQMTMSSGGNTNEFSFIAGQTRFRSDYLHTWSSSADSTVAHDVGLGRNAAGVLEINSGTAGIFRDLKARNINLATPTNNAGDVVTTDGAQTLSGKTFTAPKFADLGFIADANGNELLVLDTVTSAVNEITVVNSVTGTRPFFIASGADANIGLEIKPKGTGNVVVNSTTIPASKTLVVTTDKLSVLAATTSAELAGVISNETGTGALVLADSPGLTGTPTAPTVAVDTNTTQVATTAFVAGQASSTNPVIDGTAAPGTSLRYARQDHVHPTDTSRAPLASPALTGTPTAPTAAANTDTTQLATTAFVLDQAGHKETQTLGSAAATITFTVPSGYTNLRIICSGRIDLAAVGGSIKLRFNGDTGGNYQEQFITGSNSDAPTTLHDVSETTITVGTVPGTTTTADYAGVTVVFVPNYLGGFFKEVTAHGSTYIGTQQVRLYGGTWKNTAAITSVTLSASSSANFLAGTTATLIAE